MKSRVKFFILLFFMLFIVTGCSGSYNSSPEAVAKEMVKRLSKDDYSIMEELFYKEEGSYFDEKVFKKLIEDKELNIKDNKKIDIKEIGSEITGEDGNIHVIVKIDIDDDGVFKLETVNYKDKWYVYDESFYDGAMTFIVPKGSKVLLNGKELDSSYAGNQKTIVTLTHPDSSYKSISENNYLTYGYRIPKALKGSYDITIEGEKTVKDVVYSSYNYQIKSTNYTYKTFDDKKDGIVYTFASEDKSAYSATNEQKTSIKSFMEKFYKEIVTMLNKHNEVSVLESYFEKDSEFYAKVKSSFETSGYYNYTKSKPYKSTYSSTVSYYSDFSFDSISIKEIYYLSDDSILVAVTPTIPYKYHSYGTSSYKLSPAGLYKLKKSGDSYLIVEAYNVL